MVHLDLSHGVGDTVTIPDGEYRRLVRAQDMLNCLYQAGVDNWSGYDYALDLMEDMYPEDDEDD